MKGADDLPLSVDGSKPGANIARSNEEQVMAQPFHIFVMIQPIRYSLTIKIERPDLVNFLDNDVALEASTGDATVDGYLGITLQVVSEAIRQVNNTGNLDDAVGMIYDVEFHEEGADGRVLQKADVGVFGNYAAFQQAVAGYKQQRLH
jgi:hypothetical protein